MKLLAVYTLGSLLTMAACQPISMLTVMPSSLATPTRVGRAFGDPARRRYQALILTALQSIASTPQCIDGQQRNELAPGLRSYHLNYASQQAKQPEGTVKSRRHIVFYRVAKDQVIEIVRLLHEAMEVRMHLSDE